MKTMYKCCCGTVLMAVIGFMFIACEGPQGPMGPQGPRGPQGFVGPIHIGENGNWWVGSSDTGIEPRGEIPEVGENGNWWIGSSDTRIGAHTPPPPHIGENGNWWVGSVDTEIPVQKEIAAIEIASPPRRTVFLRGTDIETDLLDGLQVNIIFYNGLIRQTTDFNVAHDGTSETGLFPVNVISNGCAYTYTSFYMRVVRPLPSLHLSIAPYVRGSDAPNNLHRDEWRPTTVSLYGVGPYERFMFQNVRAEARGRGNSSWLNMGDKRPLRIRFDAARPMFGSSYAARDWTLIANALDHSMMRNYSAYFLGRSLDSMDFAPAGHFVHLYMDGDYRGVYMLSDQMHVHTGRVELTSNQNPALSEFLLEWCNHAATIPDFIVGGTQFVIEFPNAGVGHRDFAKDFITQVDNVLARGCIDTISQLIDIPSFIDFYLVQEFFKNYDIHNSSVFFTIRQSQEGPKLFAGPLWDFDVSSGVTYGAVHPSLNTWFASPERQWASLRHRFFRNLMDTNQFSEYVNIRWKEIRDREVRSMIGRIRDMQTTYQSCFEHNFYRWPDKNIWFTSPIMAAKSFMEHVDYLVDWFEQRKIWMDGFLQQ